MARYFLKSLLLPTTPAFGAPVRCDPIGVSSVAFARGKKRS